MGASFVAWIGRLVLGAALGCVISLGAPHAVKADDDAGGDEAVESDIEIGELGSLEDDVVVSTRRGRRGGASRSVPRFVIDPSVRTALSHRFDKQFSGEVYARGQLGTVTGPWSTRSSVAAIGAILNTRLGEWVWTNAFEASQHYRDFYDWRTYEGYEPTTALARSIPLGSLGGAPVNITPRLAVGYRMTTDTRYQRLKAEFMAPITVKLSKQLDFVITPRIDRESYTERSDHREDLTGYIAGALKYEVAKGVSVTGTIGYETRHSTTRGFSFARWKLAPQLSLRSEF